MFREKFSSDATKHAREGEEEKKQKNRVPNGRWSRGVSVVCGGLFNNGAANANGVFVSLTWRPAI